MKKIAIVGAGIGGLSTAARLAKAGHQVTVFEKLPHCGGRNQLLESNGFKFDMGPSFVLMPDFFEEVFTSCGENIRDYLDLVAIDPSYTIFFPDGDKLSVHKDSAKTKVALERFETGASDAFDGFIAETARIYNAVRPLLYKCFTPRDMVNPRYWGLVTKIHAFDSYWNIAKRFFKSEKLCYLFTFEAMFMGVSPFNAPAFYSIISYTDHVQKIFHPLGGMYEIPRALERMGKKFGATYHYNAPVTRVTPGKGTVTITVNGREEPFDKVVINADYAYARRELLAAPLPDYQYSCSVYLMYLGLRNKVPGFAHHNLFFSSDLRTNLRQIFNENVVPDDPSFYIHVPTVTDQSLAPAGKEIFYVLIPTANLKHKKDDIAAHIPRLRTLVFKKIKEVSGVDIEPLIEVDHAFYPNDFIDRYNINNGATFGLSHNLMQSAFFRPANSDPKLPGVYFVGASTQPGGGLPVVIAGSRIVADMITQGRA